MPSGRLSLTKKYEGTLTKKDKTAVPVTVQYEPEKKAFVVRGEGGGYITKAKTLTEIRRGGFNVGFVKPMATIPASGVLANEPKTVVEKLEALSAESVAA